MFAMPATPQVCAGSSGNPSVKVYARIRPLLQEEHDIGAKNILEVSPANKEVVLVEGGGEKIFRYDDVFEEYCSQERVYMKAVEPLVTKVEEGHNATVFAYGQTGSGKTFTMGTDPCIATEGEGILQRALRALLGKDNELPVDDQESISSSASRSLTVSIIEVYNEMIFDLLASSRIPLNAKAGPRGGGAISAVGMVEEKVDSVSDGLALLKKGSHLRSVGATAVNQHSSRSHALVYLTLKNGKHHGCLRLVDLAGAEGVGRTQSSGLQFIEGVNINKGLLTLGKVLAALCNPASGHVPFRESVLTRLLKDSLGGTSYTAMIACVSPANINVYETINTLRYAEQARSIKSKPHALSTVKKSGMKRRFEDVSATPGAWKKRVMASGKRQEHNSTISTPGHKPTAKSFVPTLNNTFVTPSDRMSEVLCNPVSKTGFNMPLAAPMFSTLSQPIFEDDSPSRLSTISAIESTETHPSTFSPFIDRFTSRFEQSMMTQLECIEDRMTDKIISKLTHLELGKHSCLSRKMKRQSRSRSTPTTNENIQSNTASDSSDEILGTSIDVSKEDMKSMLQDVVSSALRNFVYGGHSGSTQRSTFPSDLPSKTLSENNTFRNPLGDLTNTQKRSGTSCLRMEKKSCLIADKMVPQNQHSSSTLMDAGHVYNLPLTSTAVNQVRQSTRLSARSVIPKSLFTELSSEISSSVCPVSLMTHEESSTAVDTSENSLFFIHDTTALLRNEGSPVLRSPRFEAQLHSEKDFIQLSIPSPQSTVITRRMSLEKKSLKYLEGTDSQTCRSPMNVCLSSPLQTSKTLKPYQEKRRRSSRLSAMRAQGKTGMFVVPSSPSMEINKMKLEVSPYTQKQHHHNILKILNSGDLKKLQQLPTVGPKTAMIISNFRKLCGTFSSVEELKKVPALSKNYCKRFMKANLLSELSV
ncbi:uncharacterized protein [Panulirus ornatus]|uniref:uncharacterized protein isoform X2 n=1 Tax=Panulirus ornatus TaxID=150431 RepID=UPI003A86FE69